MSSDLAGVSSGSVKANSEESNPAFCATPPINISHLNSHLSKLFQTSGSPSQHSGSDLPYHALDSSSGHNNSHGSSSSTPVGQPPPTGVPPCSVSNKQPNSSLSNQKEDLQRPHGCATIINTAQFDSITMGLQPQTPGYPMHVPHTCITRPPVPHNPSSYSRSRRTITLGKPIPKFVMLGICFLLGINRSSNKRTMAGRVFQGLTIGMASAYLISSLVFIHKDIMSDFTKTTVVDGTVSCLFMVLWCVLGCYANGLAYRLYNNDQFRPLLRLPSKTIFGINSAVLLLLLMLLAMAVNNYSGMWLLETSPSPCDKLSLPVVACNFRFVFRVAFSVLALVWHYLVTFVLIAVSRSFTISIRQLMQTLERDGRAYEFHYMGVRHTPDDDMLLQEYTWIDEDFCTELQLHQLENDADRHRVIPEPSHELQGSDPEQDASDASQRRSSSCANLVVLDDCTNSTAWNSSAGDEGRSETPHSGSVCRPRRPTPDTADASRSLPSTPAVSHSPAGRGSTSSAVSGVFLGGAGVSSVHVLLPPSPTEAESVTRLPFGQGDRRLNPASQSGRSSQSSSSRMSASGAGGNNSSCRGCESAKQSVPLLTNAEILYQVWKIQSGLRIFGLATQRWMLSLVCVIVTWLAINLVEWLNTSPGLFDLVNLILPLLLLPLLAATFAEVNFEGERLVKFIAPTEERLGVLFWLQSAPLQLSIYGFSLSYGIITTAGFGLLVALASKVFLQEITGKAD